MPKLRAITFKSSIRQSRGFRRIFAMSFAAFDTPYGITGGTTALLRLWNP
jgi:hypothetical protein